MWAIFLESQSKKKKVVFIPLQGFINSLTFRRSYSFFARSLDEKVVQDVLSKPTSPSFPDAVIYVADSANLERNLLFFSQLYDLSLPIILVLNMWDRAQQKGLKIKY